MIEDIFLLLLNLLLLLMMDECFLKFIIVDGLQGISVILRGIHSDFYLLNHLRFNVGSQDLFMVLMNGIMDSIYLFVFSHFIW